MNHSQSGEVRTPEPSRILQRLCYHFSRKIQVRYDENEGWAEFPWGHCKLQADTEVLRFQCQANDPEGLGQVRHVIDEHISLFSRKQGLSVQWEDAVKGNSASGAPSM